MHRKLPPLNSLRAFEAAARLCSFNRASLELHVTHGAVSRHVKLLEDWLGTPLFLRLNKRVVLTEAGRAYMIEVGAALDRIAFATERSLIPGGRRLIRLNATPTLALRWLIPRISSFQQANPRIEVRLTTSNEPIESLDGSFDVVMRRRSDNVSGYVVRWSLPEHRIPVCSLKLLDQIPLRRVDDLRTHTLLYTASRLSTWPDWLRLAGVPDLRPRHSIILEHSYQAIEGAIAGLGVACGSSPQIPDDVMSGRLVLPLAGPRMATAGYCCYVPETRASEPNVNAFCSWLDRLLATE